MCVYVPLSSLQGLKSCFQFQVLPVAALLHGNFRSVIHKTRKCVCQARLKLMSRKLTYIYGCDMYIILCI